MGILPERTQPTGTKDVSDIKDIAQDLTGLLTGDYILRPGRHVKRTIYIQYGSQPDDGDRCIGLIDSAVLAEAICNRFNHYSSISKPST